jgi:hypothetical protein
VNDKLTIQFPTQGWSQILTARKEILDAYDVAREQARAHKVETFHGNVAEAACREWLRGFLPKRYGVTSGYIVSSGLKSTDKTPHFDVIIYDQIESPILWIEGNPDASEQGRSLAIPVEHVRAVFEIKSDFSAKTVKKSLEHLGDLTPLMKGPDDAQERYKLHLPPTFCCASLFFELRKEAEFSDDALTAMIGGIGLRGFFGGLILRAESLTVPHTGRIDLFKSETPIERTPAAKEPPLWEFGLSKSVRIADNVYIGARATWSESEFAKFGFDLIAMIQGTYEAGRLSSFYGIGSSFAQLMSEIDANIRMI